MRYCHRCGAPLEEDARFCPKCGTPIAAGYVAVPPPPPPVAPTPPARASSPESPTRNDTPIIIAAVCIIVIVVTVVSIAVYLTTQFTFDFSQANPNNYNQLGVFGRLQDVQVAISGLAAGWKLPI